MQTRIQALPLAKGLTAALAAIPQEAAEPPAHEVVERTERLTWIAVREVPLPSPQKLVDVRDRGRERALRTRRRQSTQFVPHPRLRPLRGTHAQISTRAPKAVLLEPKGEAQEIEALPRFAHAYHSCFGPVHRQPEILFERPFKPRRKARPHLPRQHHEIIGVPDQPRIGELGRPAGPVEGTVEVVEVDVGQQRRNDAPLRCTLPRVRRPSLPLVILLDDRAPQPQPNEPQHGLVGETPGQLLQQTVMVERVERPLDRLPITTTLIAIPNE